MTRPLIVLAVLAVCIGWPSAWLSDFVSANQGYDAELQVALAGELGSTTIHDAADFVAERGLAHAELHEQHVEAEHKAHTFVEWASLICIALGVGGGVLLYRRGPERADALARLPGLAWGHTVLVNKYFMDHAWAVVVRLAVWLQIALAQFDNWVIDGLVRGVGFSTLWLMRVAWWCDKWIVDKIVEAFAWVTAGVGEAVRHLQTGTVQFYMLVTAGAAVSAILASVLDNAWVFVWILCACILGALGWRATGHRRSA